MYILEAQGLSKQFAGFFAVQNVDFCLKEGTVHAVIGPNGAGKTTLFNLLTKYLSVTTGKILHRGEDVTQMTMPQIANRGVVRSFQISAVFASLTVLENIELALLRSNGLAWNLFGSVHRNKNVQARAMAVITKFGLSNDTDTVAANLSYGRKRVLELATTLALDPQVVLLDEPMAGLGHEDIGRVSELILEASQGRTVLLVEHNMKVVEELAQIITVMVQGQILAEGVYEDVASRSDVMAAYTGQQHD